MTVGNLRSSGECRHMAALPLEATLPPAASSSGRISFAFFWPLLCFACFHGRDVHTDWLGYALRSIPFLACSVFGMELTFQLLDFKLIFGHK